MKLTKLVLAVVVVLIAKSAYSQLRDDFPLPPSPCDSDYVEAAKNRFAKFLDVTDEVVPIVSPAQISEFETKRSELGEACNFTQFGFPLEVTCRTREQALEWQNLAKDSAYVEWVIHSDVAFLRGAPTAFLGGAAAVQGVPEEIEKYHHVDFVEHLFGSVEGNLRLLDELGGYYTTLQRLQGGQPVPGVKFLDKNRYFSAIQDARQSLYDVMMCTARKNGTLTEKRN
ncbi:hypothetical protein [Burkholderia sp. Ac-20379]|uniref:hypothetical protein n=1 Tax=Burkholderia sp. Ac-20379 TaxID=2703900 RepID=UPI00198061A1|nr:hypothetical protein [Burkholderia sp. Ac-20379]MBN3724890.1 hypothetical protein [Burkholderia sp. Ac-20379]